MDGVGLGAAGGWARPDFGAFVTEHCREVGLLAQRLCGKRDVAEEIAADAFAEAWRRWDELARPGAAPADAMGEIVQRLVHERADRADRADRAGRAGQPGRHSAAARDMGAEAEPDSARVSALLAERLALIPSQDARTVVIARIVEPVEDAPAKMGLGAKLRRPAPIAGAIVAVLLIAAGAIAMSGSGGGNSAQTNQPLIPAGPTDGDMLAGGVSPSTTASTYASAHASSPSISASATATPSASPSASPSADAAASAYAAASASPAAITASSPSLLTASTSVYGQGRNSTWSQLDISASVKQTLSALTITITVADCPGLDAAGAWNSGAGGQFNETTTTNRDGSVTYVFQLGAGDQAGPGSISFAAQFSHQSDSWDSSADSYSITAQAAGSNDTNTLSGTF